MFGLALRTLFAGVLVLAAVPVVYLFGNYIVDGLLALLVAVVAWRLIATDRHADH